MRENLLQKSAAGVIGVKEYGKTRTIRPIVWVRDTKTLYEETACASGSLALGYYLSKNLYLGSFLIRQPSTCVYRVEVDAKFVSLEGPILGVGRRRFRWRI